MTPDEADRILLTLKAAFPTGDAWIDPTLAAAREALYRTKILPLSARLMAEAVDAWLMHGTRYPTLGDLMVRYNEANVPRPELARRSEYALPAKGETIATAEEVRHATAQFEAMAAMVGKGMAVPNAKAHEKADPDNRYRRAEAESTLRGIEGRLPAPDEPDRKTTAGGES